MTNQNKLFTVEQLLKRKNLWKFKDQKIVFTNGCFDVLHPGHVHYLKEAKKLGNILIIGLNSDSSVKLLKGSKRPIHHQEDRADVLSALCCVDAITIFEEETPINIINMIRPDALVKGGDYIIDQIVGYEIVKSYGGEVITIPFVEGHSTTSILDKLILD